MGDLRADQPTIGLVLVVDELSAPLLERRIQSVREQNIDDWRLVVLDTRLGQGQPSQPDARISWLNASIAGLGEALQEATLDAELVGLLGRDCFLKPHALSAMAQMAAARPAAAIITCDGDEVDQSGVVLRRVTRPEWSPRRLRAETPREGLVVVRSETLAAVGALKFGAGDGAELELMLRLAELGVNAQHVRQPLVHDPRINRSPLPIRRRIDIVQEHLDRSGLIGVAAPATHDLVDVRLRPKPGTLVSMIIPTRGTTGPSGVMAVNAVRSMLRHVYVAQMEIIVVHDADADRAYLGDLRALLGPRLRIIDTPGPFNFSAKVNAGAAQATGSILTVLNDDVEVITPWWVDHMAALADEPDVGAVGAKLLYGDGTVQHAGQCFIGGRVGHVMAGRPDGPGPAGEHLMDREVVGVTAACMAVRREVWEELGGMDEGLPNSFNDVDFCWRLRERDYRIVQANSVRLRHFESRTRRSHARDWEIERITARLGEQLVEPDPFTSAVVANLTENRNAGEWLRTAGAVLREEGPTILARRAWSKARRGRSRTAGQERRSG